MSHYRIVSANMREAMQTPDRSNFPILLLTISHESLDDDILISSDPTERISSTDEDILYGTVSRGENYYFYPFSLALPTDEEDAPPNTRIILDNINQNLIEVLESLDARNPVNITIELIMSNDPDSVEVEYSDFRLMNADYDAWIIEGEIQMDTLYGEPVPCDRIIPSNFPGVFNA